jgi:uncharacterized protein YdaU (DUF1376 family)
MAQKIWKMGISPDNFIADTVNLTNEELGLYFRLLCYAWKNEASLPNDMDRLKRVGVNAEEKMINYLLAQYFEQDEKGYYSKAQREEWKWVQEKSGKATESAKKRWSDANAKPTQSSNSNSNKHSYTDIFNNIWSELKLTTGNKQQAFKVFEKLKDKPEPSLLVEKWNSYCSSVDDKKFIMHFRTWLNNKGWENEPQKTEVKDDFGFYRRDPFVNLSSWQKGFRTLNDNDQDIIRAYKLGKVSKEAMDKMSISVE